MWVLTNKSRSRRTTGWRGREWRWCDVSGPHKWQVAAENQWISAAANEEEEEEEDAEQKYRYTQSFPVIAAADEQKMLLQMT